MSRSPRRAARRADQRAIRVLRAGAQSVDAECDCSTSRRLPNCDAIVVTIFGDERHVLDSIEVTDAVDLGGNGSHSSPTARPQDFVLEVPGFRSYGHL